MSAKSNNQGRAYEYAWLKTLYSALNELRNTEIVENSSLKANKSAWSKIPVNKQQTLLISALSAIDSLLELEPKMIENDNDLLTLEFQKDDAGIKGDVRDIIIKRDSEHWEIGLSIKHNHSAVKHSRLSAHIDFGKEWFNEPCSENYKNEVLPIFERLKREKALGTKWSRLENKISHVYRPLLESFKNEIERAYKKNKHIPRKLVEYLIGTNDYYKIVSHDEKRVTVIHSFNVRGTLNKPSKIKVSAIKVLGWRI